VKTANSEPQSKVTTSQKYSQSVTRAIDGVSRRKRRRWRVREGKRVVYSQGKAETCRKYQ